MNARSALAALAATSAVLACPPAAAGPDLDALQARHRALLDAAATADADAVPASPRPGAEPASALLQAGGPAAASAPLVADPLPRGPGLALRLPVVPAADDGGPSLRLGVVARGNAIPTLEGSEARLPLGPGAAYLSYESRHWGPGWFGSLILDGAAPAIAAVGWRTEGATHWRADVFAGTLAGHHDPADPRLIGMRLEWRPTLRWTVGLARTLQWGGKGRDESLRSLVNGLLGRDTVGRDGVNLSNEPGNQMGGVDLRWDHPIGDGAAIGVYAQLVAEDKATIVPSRRLQLGGLDASRRFGAWTLRGIVELTQTTAGKAHGLAYRHHLYPAGYTQRGRVLGHPIGGDARLASVALLVERGPSFAIVALHRGRALEGAQRFPDGARLDGADVSLGVDATPALRLGLGAQHWRAGTASEQRAWAWARYSWP